VLEKIYLLAKEQYEKYETSFEEDEKILAEDKDLTFNLRNCILYRHGEKVILRFLMNSCQKMLPLLDMDFKVIYKAKSKLNIIVYRKQDRQLPSFQSWKYAEST
jgi:hypothetical protein